MEDKSIKQEQLSDEEVDTVEEKVNFLEGPLCVEDNLKDPEYRSSPVADPGSSSSKSNLNVAGDELDNHSQSLGHFLWVPIKEEKMEEDDPNETQPVGEGQKSLTTTEIIAQLQVMKACDIPGTSLDVFITSPDDSGPDDTSDADSGDKDDFNRPDKMCDSQLRAKAEIVVYDDSSEIQGDINSGESLEPTAKKARIEHPKFSRSWKMGRIRFDPLPQQHVTCSSASSVTKDFSPLDFWEIFCTKDVINMIVQYTNLYASQNNEPNLQVTPEEVYCVLGTLYLSGYNPQVQRRMYWELARDCHNELISDSIRRNRFEDIFRFFHVCGNNNVRKNDKMAKLREFMNALNKSFVENAPNESNLSVDKSLIPYFGRHGCREFIKGKPVRFGYKAWTLAQKQGYCMQFDIYQGAKTTGNVDVGESVVMNFCDVVSTAYPRVSFSFYCDDFFTCPSLLSKLKERGMRCTGTVKANRMEGCSLSDKKELDKRDRGYFESFVDSQENILAVTWNDNNIVHMISNEYGIEPVQEAERYSFDQKKRVKIPQPFLIAKYNENMGGVDQLETNISTYRINIRSKKWYMPILLWLLDVAMNNAWILSRYHGLKLDALGFRRFVVTSLLEKYGTPPLHVRTRPSVSAAMRESHGGHLLVGDQARKRCRVCKNKTVRACQKCKVALHVECFAKFHE